MASRLRSPRAPVSWPTANLRLQSEIAERVRAERSAREGENRLAIVCRASAARGRGDGAGHLGRRRQDGRSRVVATSRRPFSGLPSDCGADPALFASLIHPEDRDRVDASSIGGRTMRRERRDLPGPVSHHAALATAPSWVAGDWARALRCGRQSRSAAIGTLADVTERRRTELALAGADGRARDCPRHRPHRGLARARPGGSAHQRQPRRG